MSRLPVAVVGATGAIGQRFISLLQDHPMFEIAVLTASERKVGGRLSDFWRLEGALDPDVGGRELQSLDVKLLERAGVSAAFSGLPADLARDFETDAARAGIRVFSNASSHRMEADVPLLVPEVNAEHIALVERQPTFERGGFIVTNPNCSVTGLVLALKPLVDAFDFDRVHVATYQALSGAGYPGVPSLDIEGNVLPFIDQEEEQMRREAKKLLGRWSGGIWRPSRFPSRRTPIRTRWRRSSRRSVGRRSASVCRRLRNDRSSCARRRIGRSRSSTGWPASRNGPGVWRRRSAGSA